MSHANPRPAAPATTPNYGGTTRYCAWRLASSSTTTSSTSAAGPGRRPERPLALPRQGVRWGSTSPAPAIERARELARAERLRNVTFEQANAQLHTFPQDRFDLAISRFGTMFFDNPVDAFANIRRALRPAGRLTMMVWQAHEHNEWDVAIRQALGADEAPVAPPSVGSDPFSLADPPTVKEILEAADLPRSAFTDVDEPVYYGPDVAAALDWVNGFTSTAEVLKRLDPACREGRGRASARDARCAHERRRHLVQLQRLDRHRPSSLRGSRKRSVPGS